MTVPSLGPPHAAKETEVRRATAAAGSQRLVPLTVRATCRTYREGGRNLGSRHPDLVGRNNQEVFASDRVVTADTTAFDDLPGVAVQPHR